MSAQEEEHHDDFAHVAEKKVLFGTIVALLILTVLTVMATWWDFGRQVNLFIAMLIATIKAALVCAFFMHLRYDKRFHTVALMSALLFAVLFAGFSLMDRATYESDVIWDVDNPPDNP